LVVYVICINAAWTNKYLIYGGAFNCSQKGICANEERGNRELGKPHNDAHHGLHSSPNTIRVIKSRKKKEVEHVARMAERRAAYRVSVGKPLGMKPF